MNHPSHQTRYSDSSLYDEVCTLCGATDARNDDRLRHPCGQAPESDKDKLFKAAAQALMTIDAIYQWVDRVEKAGGATSISGVAECHAMLKSLQQNRPRVEKLIVKPLREALESKNGK